MPMATVDLSTRLTSDLKQYSDVSFSDASFVYISPLPVVDAGTTADLCVGDEFVDTATGYSHQLPSDGYTLRSHRAVVIFTRETVWLPSNVAGVVLGKGARIFEGVFISPGKISPGFHGRLRIGLFNGSPRPIKLTKGMPVGCCMFFQSESSWLEGPSELQTPHPLPPLSLLQKLKRWVTSMFDENWIKLVTALIALVSALTGAIVIIIKVWKGVM